MLVIRHRRCLSRTAAHSACSAVSTVEIRVECGGGNPVSVHHSCPGNPGGKSGVSSSFLPVEIRCQFIILARGNPVSVHHSGEIRCQFIILARGKSGVSSSFLPGKSGVLQPIMPLDSPVKVRPWELTVYPRSHIRR